MFARNWSGRTKQVESIGFITVVPVDEGGTPSRCEVQRTFTVRGAQAYVTETVYAIHSDGQIEWMVVMEQLVIEFTRYESVRLVDVRVAE